MKPQVICLCGSTKFKREFEAANREATLAGAVVLAPGVFGHADGIKIFDEDKAKLDALHLKKIEMADVVWVVCPGGYIGQSTQREIEYADKIGKPVVMLDQKPKLVLQRPLCVIDIEATGVEVAVDRIVTLAVLRIDPPDLFHKEARETRTLWMVNPGCMIPADSTRIHGITDEMVKDCPRFKEVAAEVRAMLSDADLCGFNLRNFDVPLLWEEMNRAGCELPLDNVKVVDASEIFRKKEPRTLTAAVKKYCGRDHEGAHEAMADVTATWDVLHGQLAAYPDLLPNVAALAELASEEYEGRPAKRLDLCGYIIEDADGIARYTLKKVRGVPVLDDPGFGEWMLRNSFPAHTCKVLRKLLEDYL